MVICTVPACYQAVPEHQGQDVLRWAGGCSPGKQPPSPAGCSRWSGQQRWPSPLAPKHPHTWLFFQELPLPFLRGRVQRASAPQQREEG